MIKPSWSAFRAKFAENLQNNFEWFCYLLFCKEFNKPRGIFRYTNQAAIETDPILVADDHIGWQAKFYDSSLSAHKSDLLETLKKAKEYYPQLTKLLIYSNQEWGQYKGEPPVGLTEIEKKATELKIVLEWRTTSYFETEFVCNECEVISKHFFTLDKSIINLILEQKQHTKVILSPIQDRINFKAQVIELDRSDYVAQLSAPTKQITVLSGVGGVGKTAVIKKLFEQFGETSFIYVFKANEFEVTSLNDFFKDYSLYEFSEIHKNEENKTIVIDSAERLLDLSNLEPFKEFLTEVISKEWRIIFTTRDSYLDDLNYQFFEIYKIAPHNISLRNLNHDELIELADKHSFTLPKDEKLLELLKSPFYLEEYLNFYSDKETHSYTGFKNKLWNKNIKKSKPDREICFLDIAYERANKGQFYVKPTSNSGMLEKLVADGILGYESPGYFITHDIYEEWAIERHIDNVFVKMQQIQGFYESIGESLSIRRSFRNWLSEKLLLESEDIKAFIPETLQNEAVPAFWKDEIFASVLLSDYSKVYFKYFKNDLISKELSLLKKLTFILRIACKEVDDDFLKLIGFRNSTLLSAKYVFTKPKGQGWPELIKFVYENLEAIGIQNISFVLPVLHDWTSKFKVGETTKLSSKIALRYYEWSISQQGHYSDDTDAGKMLLQSIVYGASEIKDDLSAVFEKVIENKWKDHTDPYYGLIKFILSKLEAFGVSNLLPSRVLKIAELYWTYTPQEEEEDDDYSSDYMDLDRCFGIEKFDYDHDSASPYKTPMYALLAASSFRETLDFILHFTNKCVTAFSSSRIGKSETKEITVHINDGLSIKQFISNRIWCIYRGTQTGSHLLESIHMALEKRLLEYGKSMEPQSLEGWLIYALKNSNSASITALVASIVLAYPEKTFNIAKILFQNKDFFKFDRSRYMLDLNHKSQLQVLNSSFGTVGNELHVNDRISACDDKHRKMDLENLCLHYQVFRAESVSEEESANRQTQLWEIFDKYYSELPIESEQSYEDKLWRLCLARMDKRKISITTEKAEGGVAIRFNPEIDPSLQEFSDKALQESQVTTQYLSLKLWAETKLKNDEQYKQYKYHHEFELAFEEAKVVYRTLCASAVDEEFRLLNRSIPALVSCVLIRDYFQELSDEQKELCKKIILEVATFSTNINYQYQIGDGLQEVFSLLPNLLEKFPKEKPVIKYLLLMGLFNQNVVGGMLSTQQFSVYSLIAIQELWAKHYDDAHALLLGFLILKPLYDAHLNKASSVAHANEVYHIDWYHVRKDFLDENQALIDRILDNNITLADIPNLEEIKLKMLNVAFRIIPNSSDHQDHKKLARKIISIFAQKLSLDKRDVKIRYEVKNDFFERLAFYILSLPHDQIKENLNPFLETFSPTRYFSEFFQKFVIAEDRLNSQENFWLVWDLFKDKIIEAGESGEDYAYVDEVIQSYLFANCRWKETTTEWHSLQEDNLPFLHDISIKLGQCPSTLYSISKLLNDIGSNFLNDGVFWIVNILNKNKTYKKNRMHDNTIYYMEHLIRKYIFMNKEKIKKTITLKNKVLVILDFLVAEGSVVGYMLRESVL